MSSTRDSAETPRPRPGSTSPSLEGRPRLDAIRERLRAERGPTYWRSLDELAESPEVQEELAVAFPQQAAVWADPVGRRSFLQLMGASISLAGLGACTRQPAEYIAPWSTAPESLLPGEARYFATAFALGGAAQGLLVESHMGRPTKIEGNPSHPANLGATDPIAQAQVLGLYDPDRSQTVTRSGRISTSAEFSTALKNEVDALTAKGGAGLRVLSQAIDSPTLAAQRDALLAKFPQAGWHEVEPVHRDGARGGALAAFGEDVDARYDLSKAKVVLSLDAELLTQGPGASANARAFAAGRRGRAGATSMNRLYTVEATPTLVGASADHRLAVPHSEVAAVALAIAKAIPGSRVTGELPADFAHSDWCEAVARDLGAHRGASVVIAGAQQPAQIHAIAHALNTVLGNVGSAVEYAPASGPDVPASSSMRQLVNDMHAGRVEALVVLGGNPVYDAPADLRFPEAFERVPFRVHLGLYEDETAVASHWHVPESHFLESWGDVRSHDGTVSIVQPLIAPLYDGVSAHELLATMLGGGGTSAYDAVREHWRAQPAFAGAEDFETAWRQALHDGVISGTRVEPTTVALASEIEVRVEPAGDEGTLELALRPDAHVWDGRFANNGWLQELPKPATRLTWDNAALISPATAEELELRDGDLVELTASDDALEVPVWTVPGHANGAVTLHLGYGRERGGKVGIGAGVSAYRVQHSSTPFSRRSVTLRKLGRRAELACTQDHHGMEEGLTGDGIQARLTDLLRVETFDRFSKRGDGNGHGDGHHGPVSLLDDVTDHEWDGHAWGMVIDLNACIGCSSCTIACQAENNIPVVGREEVARGREMHWIRVDRYFGGDPENPDTHHQPVPCMHCEHAPCEVVCPVGATVHSKEGLNDMVYNRCIGTRYCSNNCPYKVRRFNFFQYADYDTESIKLLWNPDVTVRYRGVMEKCTYCVQRINSARIDAKKENRRVRDGEIVTACQQVCPTQAIAFGDINDPDSEVSHLREEPHQYGMLDRELNTRPRTTYLSKLTNPNPALAPAPEGAEPGDDEEPGEVKHS